MTESKHEFEWLIRQRTEAKAARRRERRNPYATRAHMPFSEWLFFVHQIDDWKSIRPYKRWELYNSYQIDCITHGLEFEQCEQFGIFNPLID